MNLYISPQLMKGYHGDRLSSSQVLNNGWLTSGDLVKKLDTGHIELVGRKKIKLFLAAEIFHLKKKFQK